MSPAQLPSADLLEEICVRFILTLPATELESFERLLFSIEQAWWHYEDHVREKPENTALKSLTLKEFTGLIFEKVPGLQPFRGSLEEIYAQFNAYKRTVPVRGAIVLTPDMSKCLLVRGYKKDAGWGFPRGKLSKDETDAQCAVREVEEETGLDITDLLNKQDFIDAQLGDQDTRLFIVQGVPETTHFAPHVRYEIGAFGWYLVDHLPASYDESKQAFVNEQGGRHKFFNVWPYIRPLRAWIKKRRQQQRVSVQSGGKVLVVPVSAGKKAPQQAATKVAAAAAAAPAASRAAAPPQAAAAQAAAPPPATAAAAAAAGAPGRSLREFRFDHAPILQALQLA
ncbi:mRNA-decapping enzyme subunit 2 [Micractinium conductrix]|uniref:mRNA-decapping enzyme subunit 2 n=1 Tax=Micractinium conductrix TaxID=554055 RepID=A0A2P6V5M9_9CHLO|nr:mRNA-decapping enzyme subunit 2 [Micractinium conductrix]|eukprot:PSC69393.1 mRNA-decapping enzyme subunit 2 [Micractinium conductrix]